MNRTTLITAIKEAARLVVFSLPGLLIQIFTKNPNLALGYGSLLLYVLKAVDRSIHEDPEIKANGLLPF